MDIVEVDSERIFNTHYLIVRSSWSPSEQGTPLQEKNKCVIALEDTEKIEIEIKEEFSTEIIDPEHDPKSDDPTKSDESTQSDTKIDDPTEIGLNNDTKSDPERESEWKAKHDEKKLLKSKVRVKIVSPDELTVCHICKQDF